jgi:hypothetical protein
VLWIIGLVRIIQYTVEYLFYCTQYTKVTQRSQKSIQVEMVMETMEITATTEMETEMEEETVVLVAQVLIMPQQMKSCSV